jgi:putative hydrolase of the HAD superfamily
VAYDAVLFDLDGTLCERTQDTDELYRAAFERVGVEPFAEPDALWASLRGPPDHDDRVGYLGAGFARLAARHGRGDVDPLALAAAFIEQVDDRRVQLLPGATTALDAAAANGPVGLVTNGPARRQRPKLESLGVADRFDVEVYAFDLPRRKPHADPLDRALDALDVAADGALYVGDSLAYDVASAHNAGLAAAWLGDSEDRDGYDPDYVLDSVGDVAAILEGER